jgi:hypothetical protein
LFQNTVYHALKYINEHIDACKDTPVIAVDHQLAWRDIPVRAVLTDHRRAYAVLVRALHNRLSHQVMFHGYDIEI